MERYVYGNGGTGEDTLTWKQLADHYMRLAACCMINAMPDEAIPEVRDMLLDAARPEVGK